MRYQWLLAIPLIFACRFAVPQAMPASTDSEYFKTIASGTLLNKNVVPTGIVFYLNLKVKKPLPRNAVIVVELENPVPKAAPVEVVLDLVPAKKEILIQSPSMACITNGEYYRTILTLFADSSRRRILSTHVQIIALFMEPDLFNDFNVPACPAF